MRCGYFCISPSNWRCARTAYQEFVGRHAGQQRMEVAGQPCRFGAVAALGPFSHNLAAVRHVSDRVAVMYLGRIVEEGAVDEVFDRPKHPYTRFLLDTVPNLDQPKRDRVSAAIDLPSPINPPPGCSYNPRSPLVTSLCRSQAPEVRPLGGALVRCHNTSA